MSWWQAGKDRHPPRPPKPSILASSPSLGCGRSRQPCRLPRIFVLGRALPRDALSGEPGASPGPSWALLPHACSRGLPGKNLRLALLWRPSRWGDHAGGHASRGHWCFCTSREQTEALFQAVLSRVQGARTARPLGTGRGGTLWGSRPVRRRGSQNQVRLPCGRLCRGVQPCALPRGSGSLQDKANAVSTATAGECRPRV